MAAKKPMHLRLIEGAGNNGGIRDASAPQQSDFYRTLVHHSDEKEAVALAAEQAGLDWDASHPELEQIKLELPDLDERYNQAKRRQEKLEDALDKTPKWIKSSEEQTGDTNPKVKLSEWQMIDKVSFCFLLAALIVMLFMSASNVYANLRGSGEPIFIEQPWLAVFLSMLAPAGSVALKFISGFFDFYRTKRRYTLFIFTLTTASFLAWLSLFSINYTGVASGIDWNSFGQASGKGSLLVFTQLLTEVLAGGALFLAAQDIALKYSPELYRENPAHAHALRARDDQSELLAALRDERNSKHARFAQLKTERQAFINKMVAAYLATRARFKNLSNF